MEWFDIEYGERRTLKINDKQREFMEFLLEELELGTILDDASVSVKITENENQVIDLT